MKEENKQIAVHEAPSAPEGAAFLNILQNLAVNESVDPAKMHSILDLMERQQNKVAAQAYENALADLQDEMPRIKKDGRIEHKDRLISTYATYEAIDDVIRPLLKKYGFTLRFSSKQLNDKVLVSGTLAHRGGHKETIDTPLSIDQSGAKNSVQGVGSTISYGKRYIVSMFFNIITEGEDDDGNKAAFIAMTDEQARTVKTLIQESKTDTSSFLKWANAQNVEAMDARKYEAAVRMLNQKKTALKEGE